MKLLPLSEPPRLRSWFMGGFEGASMRLDTGRRVDVIGATQHDYRAAEDYKLLSDIGVLTLRDALRWHRIETAPGQYDWSSARHQINAAREIGVQVIWDLAHFGYPDWLDPWSGEFPKRFTDYAAAAAELIIGELGTGGVWCPINEMSYWAFGGGEQAHFAPFGLGRGREWKRQLARAAIGASRRIRASDPTSVFLQPEPAIHIGAETLSAERNAQRNTEAMFEAWDMIIGIADPELGGSPALIDYIGINYYANNQWMEEGRRLGMGELAYRPFADIVMDVWRRYKRPIVITETGAEGPNLRGWLRYVAGELEDAETRGADIAGVCLYPISDYPGWTDNRHCSCGLIDISADMSARRLRDEHVPLVHQIFKKTRTSPGP